MSWLSSKLSRQPMDSSIIFDCLKASTIGLGNGSCDELFECDMDIINSNLMIRRQKRSASEHKFQWSI